MRSPEACSALPTTAIVKGFDKPVAKINALEPEISPSSDEQLRAKTTEFRERLARARRWTTCCPRRSPRCARSAKRTLGQRHFDVS